jgi:restriction system protein
VARHKKTSPAEDWIEVVALMPWWVGVTLAVVSYLLLRHVASREVATAVQPAQFGELVTQTLWKTMATFGQYILPVICVAGAGTSAWRRRERLALVTNGVESKAADILDGMSWQQFEQLVGEAFRLQGYKVSETGGGGADGGVDLVLHKGGEKFLVQCKQWRAFKVGVNVVRELYGVMAAKGAAGGFVVTSGRFTEEATRFSSGRNISLVDGAKLHGLVQQAHAARRQGSAATAKVASSNEHADPAGSAVPSCTICAKPMVKRTAKRGANVGGGFWGCTGYPACKGTRQMAQTGRDNSRGDQQP